MDKVGRCGPVRLREANREHGHAAVAAKLP
jgi:hypothetical protein